jgi:hypothetical protein
MQIAFIDGAGAAGTAARMGGNVEPGLFSIDFSAIWSS